MLLPSMRDKKRYIAFEVLAENAVTREMATKSIRDAMHQYIGDLGMSQAGLSFLPDWDANKGILCVNRNSVNEAKASIALVNEVGGKKAAVKSIAVSGILNKARQKSKEGN